MQGNRTFKGNDGIFYDALRKGNFSFAGIKRTNICDLLAIYQGDKAPEDGVFNEKNG